MSPAACPHPAPAGEFGHAKAQPLLQHGAKEQHMSGDYEQHMSGDYEQHMSGDYDCPVHAEYSSEDAD
ncbi:MAG: hypothetical protein MUO76_24315 [Anaerolineaceae bacterium]|nr:hypothetical protein [Anaerolineaceae bacterium]